MNWQILNNQSFTENIGWTLIHSLWQISLIGFLLFVALRILKNAPANLRYLFSVAAMFLLIALPIVTFFSYDRASASENKSVLTKSAETSQTFAVKTDNQAEKSPNVSENINSLETIVELSLPKESRIFQGLTKNSFDEFLPYLVWFWFSGMLFFSFRLGGGIWKTRRIKTRQTSFVGTDWQEKFDALAEKTGIRRRVAFIQSEIVETPMVIGWLKPFVIVPASVLAGINPRELETIIAHELIHIRRHDFFVNTLQSFVEIVLFFHPATWWISSQIRRERENACDDAVLKIFDTEPLLYASALANLEDFRLQSNNLTPSNIVAANGGNLMLRIQRIIKRNRENYDAKASLRPVLSIFLFVAAFLSSVMLVGWHIAAGKNNAVESDQRTRKIAVGLAASSSVLLSENSAEEDLETMRRVAAKLKQNNIPTTGFIKGGSINVRDENSLAKQQKNVELWRKAGFELGILDYKYPQSFDAKISDYYQALQKREDAPITELVKKHTEMLKDSKQKRDKILNPSKEEAAKQREGSFKQSQQYFEETRKLLKDMQTFEREWQKKNNLFEVRYTVGGEDWLYAYVYDVVRKRNDEKMMREIKAKFIDYMAEILTHSEKYHQHIYEREIPQTLHLTPSRLLADSADELFAMFRNRGYKFVAMDEVLQDENYPFNKEDFYNRDFFRLNPEQIEKTRSAPPVPSVDAKALSLWSNNQPKN